MTCRVFRIRDCEVDDDALQPNLDVTSEVAGGTQLFKTHQPILRLLVVHVPDCESEGNLDIGSIESY